MLISEARQQRQDRSPKGVSRFRNNTIQDREELKMNAIYRSTESKTLSGHCEPVSVHIVSEYLKQVILPGDNSLEMEITRFTAHQHEQINTFGAARLEILFYEKTASGEDREQIILYGIAENVCSQLKSFTLSFDTCWLDSRNRHPEDRYFDSIIVDRPGFSRLIPSSSLELNLRNANGMLAGYCAVAFRFASSRLERTAHRSRAAPSPEIPAASTP